MGAEMGAVAPVAVDEMRAYLRIDDEAEDALLAGLVRSATSLCEAFTGQWLIERPFLTVIAASAAWQRLAMTPIAAIETVSGLASDGTARALAATAYLSDIDNRGDGWVRLVAPIDEPRLQVSGRAGLGSNPNAVPEGLRQGIIRLASHLYHHRDGDDGEPPAAVTALWRPFRRLRLA